MPRDAASPPPSAPCWSAVADDMRRAMLCAGRPPATVDRILADLEPVFAAVERARGRVEDELCFALLGVAADRARRRAQARRSRAACLAIAFVALLAPHGAGAQVNPSPVAPRACAVSTVTTGGSAVNALSGPATGFYIANAATAADEGTDTAEPLYVDPVGTAGGSGGGNGTTEALAPGEKYVGTTNIEGGVSVSVNAATSGHKFTCVRW